LFLGLNPWSQSNSFTAVPRLSFFLKIVCPKFIRTFSTCEPHVLGFDITEMRKPEKDLILLG
jgi:hypothetical protein